MRVQPTIYQYSLTDSSGNYLSWVNNALVTSSTPTPLTYSPDGWVDQTVRFQRNTKYHGINRSMTFPLRFVNDGAKILKYKYYTEGSEAIVNLVVEKNNTTTFQYEPYYTGEVDLSNFKDELEFVEVDVIEGGLAKYLKAGENTTYEIPLEVPQAIPLYFDSLAFKDTLNFEIQEQSYAVGRNYFYTGMTFLNNEGTSIGVTYYTVFGTVVSNYDFTSLNYFLSTSQSTITMNFKFTLKFNITSHIGSNNLKFQLHTATRQYDLIDIVVNSNGSHEYHFDFDWQVLAGEQVYLFGDPNGNGLVIEMQTTPFIVSYDSQAAPTTFLGHTSKYVLNYLINKITEGNYPASSLFLSNIKSSVLLTSGDGIRGLTGAVIKTSLNDFFKSHDSLYSLGLGEDTGTAIMERRGVFYLKDTVIADIGEVKDLNVSVASDLIHNLIKVGYPDQKYDERNGRDEFNTMVEFSAPPKRVVKTLDLISTYRADMYGIAITHANLDGKKTTDSKSDNDVFFLNVTPKTTLNAGTASQMQRVVPLTVSATLNEKKLVLFQSSASSFSTTDFKSYTYLDFPGVVKFTSVDFSITITDAVNPSVKKIQLFKNDQPFATTTLDGSGTVSISAAIIIKPGDVVSAGITRNAIGDYSIDAADMTFNFQSYTLYELSRPAGYTITGVIDPTTAFNIEFSPKRNLERHGGWIRSFLQWMDALYIKFQSTPKNGELRTHFVNIIADITVTEKEDVLIGSLADRIYLPHYLTLKVALPYNILDTIKTNPYGVIRFHWKGYTIDGFVIDVAHKPSNREEQTIKLLSSPINDLTTLVTVN